MLKKLTSKDCFFGFYIVLIEVILLWTTQGWINSALLFATTRISEDTDHISQAHSTKFSSSLQSRNN